MPDPIYLTLSPSVDFETFAGLREDLGRELCELFPSFTPCDESERLHANSLADKTVYAVARGKFGSFVIWYDATDAYRTYYRVWFDPSDEHYSLAYSWAERVADTVRAMLDGYGTVSTPIH